ncbi:hypothetical protein [Gimesia aquarii]|uniref:Uncharacterized protein n=1 Tax=Gimesia aquarii TaxID=2527964 RepID=A0A517VZT7_9PLAN|nr:hypothetical protein [Gimesia aquarii]QDT98500.1 hypothetical protein V144x_40020 [Gimesia aquarii]
MTTAVCFQCGHLKFGSFVPCDQCQARPRTDDEMIISLAMTDHYFDQATLESMRNYILEHGHAPDLDPESKKTFRKTFEEVKASGAIEKMLNSFEDDSE